MKPLLIVALSAVAVYGALLIALYLAQRALLFPAPPTRDYVSPQRLGMTFAREVPLSTTDGETVMTWRMDAAEGRPTILYFHGNADSLVNFADLMQHWHNLGFGASFVTYRGYPGSTGRPSEQAIIADAKLAYDALVNDGISPDDIIVAGYSLGSAVAVALAGEREARGLYLLAAISAADDIAKRSYPFLPVRELMRDPFRSVDRIGAVRAPVFLVHGAEDRLAPLRDAERLYDAAPMPKRFLVVEDAGHIIPPDAGWDAFLDFLAKPP
ncbi:MAG: alpha/beta hydrolase [Pseudomonadota bacterium]